MSSAEPATGGVIDAMESLVATVADATKPADGPWGSVDRSRAASHVASFLTSSAVASSRWAMRAACSALVLRTSAAWDADLMSAEAMTWEMPTSPSNTANTARSRLLRSQTFAQTFRHSHGRAGALKSPRTAQSEEGVGTGLAAGLVPQSTC
jgi:hypothetical protein